MVLAPKLAKFCRDYPDVTLELTTTEESRLDLVGAGFDAGIHLGEFVERDMVAVRVSREQRAAIVGAPGYFASHPKPQSPRDLTAHRVLPVLPEPPAAAAGALGAHRGAAAVSIQSTSLAAITKPGMPRPPRGS